MAGLGIGQPRQRIVEQQQRRPGRQGPRQRQPPLPNQRQLVRSQRQAVAQPHRMRQRDHLLFQQLAAGQPQRHRNVVPHGEVRVIGAATVHQRHLAVAPAIQRHLAAVHVQSPRVGTELPGQHPEQRRLARPGRPHDGQRTAKGDVERQRAQYIPAPVPQTDPVTANRHAERTSLPMLPIITDQFVIFGNLRNQLLQHGAVIITGRSYPEACHGRIHP